jgi:hypothetical protein
VLWKLTWVALLFVDGRALAAEDVPGLLRRQSQELLDAVTAGAAAVWDTYLDEKAIYTAEDGTVLTKSQLVEQVRPLPAGISGTIRVLEFHAVVHGAVAIASYLIDEHEDYYGRQLHCQYRNTDTWLQTPAGWRLIAGQVLALRTDPPALDLNARQIEEYSGRYALNSEIRYEIGPQSGGLEGQRTRRAAEILLLEAPDVLFVPGKPRYRKVFLRGPDGRITGFAERREAWDIRWTRLP